MKAPRDPRQFRQAELRFWFCRLIDAEMNNIVKPERWPPHAISADELSEVCDLEALKAQVYEDALDLLGCKPGSRRAQQAWSSAVARLEGRAP